MSANILYSVYPNESEQSPTARFIVGEVTGDNPLICIGFNPSKTRIENRVVVHDHTTLHLVNYYKFLALGGYIMLNLCPLYSTDPKKLPDTLDPELYARNIAAITDVFDKYPDGLYFAAWGDLPDTHKRSYIYNATTDIISAPQSDTLDWVSANDFKMYPKSHLTAKGNPRHFCRFDYNPAKIKFEKFNVKEYASTRKWKK
jgi:serine/threonine protein phosphatase 1